MPGLELLSLGPAGCMFSTIKATKALLLEAMDTALLESLSFPLPCEGIFLGLVTLGRMGDVIGGAQRKIKTKGPPLNNY